MCLLCKYDINPPRVISKRGVPFSLFCCQWAPQMLVAFIERVQLKYTLK